MVIHHDWKVFLKSSPRKEYRDRAIAVVTLRTVTMGNDEQRQLEETLENKGIASDELQQKSELKNSNRNISYS